MTTTLIKEEAGVRSAIGSVPASERFKMSTLSSLGVLALLKGFGLGWLVFRDAGVSVPSDVETLMGDYQNAWVARDGDAAVALMEDGAYFYSFATPEGLKGEALAEQIEATFGGPASRVEITAVEGDGPWLVVSTASEDPGDFSVVHIADRGGDLKILGHIWMDD